MCLQPHIRRSSTAFGRRSRKKLLAGGVYDFISELSAALPINKVLIHFVFALEYYEKSEVILCCEKSFQQQAKLCSLRRERGGGTELQIGSKATKKKKKSKKYKKFQNFLNSLF